MMKYDPVRDVFYGEDSSSMPSCPGNGACASCEYRKLLARAFNIHIDRLDCWYAEEEE